MRRNILVIGAGPAGLSLARALAHSPHRVTLVERQPLETLASPPPDGREIALTQRSRAILTAMGVWPRLPRDEIFPLEQARVRNGGSAFALSIAPDRGDALGTLVSNHHIREALFDAVAQQGNVQWITGKGVASAHADERGAHVVLDDGTELRGALLVAADSRFSGVRDQLGIGASVERLERTMLVARFAHSRPHHGVATEWFAYGRTVALLPLGEGMSSLVLTLKDAEAREIVEERDRTRIEARFRAILDGQCGAIELRTQPTAWPLAMTYAERFSAPRAVLIGDAAVGMHPVTAHGFNFGLLGAHRLARLIDRAPDPGSRALLLRYALRHRAATWPLYQMTRNIVRLFTDERPAARPMRTAVLHLGALPPVRHAMARLLSERKAAETA